MYRKGQVVGYKKVHLKRIIETRDLKKDNEIC